MVEKIIESLKDYFKDKGEVLLAFVFGSLTSGRLTKESDVDIAVLFDRMPDFHEVIKIKAEVLEAIGREVDIVVLNGSSPIIGMQVLKKGRLIKSVDDAVYGEFFVKTVKEYDDLKHVRKEAEEKILKGRIYA